MKKILLVAAFLIAASSANAGNPCNSALQRLNNIGAQQKAIGAANPSCTRENIGRIQEAIRLNREEKRAVAAIRTVGYGCYVKYDNTESTLQRLNKCLATAKAQGTAPRNLATSRTPQHNQDNSKIIPTPQHSDRGNPKIVSTPQQQKQAHGGQTVGPSSGRSALPSGGVSVPVTPSAPPSSLDVTPPPTTAQGRRVNGKWVAPSHDDENLMAWCERTNDPDQKAVIGISTWYNLCVSDGDDLRWGLKEKETDEKKPTRSTDSVPSGPCARGSGLKPDPTGFGRWTCQELGGNLRPDTDPRQLSAETPSTSDSGKDATTSTARRDKAPARFKGVAPDVRAEILTLGDSVIDIPEDDPARDRLVRLLERRLADNRVRMKPQELACLQPVSGTSQRLQDIPLRWKPEHIKKEAIDRSHLCDGVPEGDAKEACREEKYGQAVMWAEPELAGQCRTAEMPNNRDVDAIPECAKRKFLSAWLNNHGIASAPTPSNWIMPSTCNAKASPAIRKQTLRDILAASLAAADSDQNNDGENGKNKTTPESTVADSPSPPPSPLTDENEAYCNYMARLVVRGELTPSPATAIPPECRATIAAALELKTQQQAR